MTNDWQRRRLYKRVLILCVWFLVWGWAQPATTLLAVLRVVAAGGCAAIGPFWKYRKTVEIGVAPCSRYRIVARYDNLTHVESTPVIHPEPTSEYVLRVAAGATRTTG